MELWLGIGLLLALIMAGVPVWIAIISGSMIIILGPLDTNLIMVAELMYGKVSQLALIGVPMFILSGQLLAVGGASAPMVRVLNSFMGHIPGGPAYVLIVACTIFGAMSSSSMAAIAGFGPLLIPMMIQAGYSKRFALGLLLASVSLAPLIPPSIPLILFGFLTETSIRDLYMAGFIPGLLLTALLSVTVFIHTRGKHYTPPPKATWSERLQALKEAWPVLLMPPVILVPIYMGWLHVYEAAVVAVLYSLLLGFVAYKGLRLGTMWESIRNTVRITAMVFAIVAAAFMLNHVFAGYRMPFHMNDWLANSGFSANTFMIVVILMYFVMGMILDPSAILMISAPLLIATVRFLGIPDIVFGLVVVFSIEIAGITPPYGLHIFAAVGILKEDFATCARAVLMFYPALIVGQLMIAYIHKISLFL
ncbi:TRAP transporter large permease, partial [Chloroflexota bacterium]